MIYPSRLDLTVGFLMIISANAGLYSDSDDVFILTSDNFYENVLKSEKIWNIEFYNSWCGHCIHFAPTYKELATDTKGWTPVIQTAAIDCAEKDNRDICMKYVDMGYPTLKLLGPNASKNDSGPQYYVRTVEEIEAALTQYATNLTILGAAPQSWPNLLPLVTVEAIWNEARAEHKHLALVFEDEQSLVGRQVILDMSTVRNILVRRMTKKSMAKFGINHFPSLFLVMKDGRFKELAQGKTERKYFTEALYDVVKTESAAQDSPVNQESAAGKKDGVSVDKNDPVDDTQPQNVAKQAVYMQDLESTLTYCFRQEIAIHREIQGDKLSALRQFLKILLKYFPGREEVTKFLLNVNRWLKDASWDLSGIHWVHNIDSLQSVDAFLPETIKWIGCHGSKPQFRGYPCGMWTLFHTLTVSAYQAGKNTPKHLYREALEAIKGYMENFFGCSVCSSHFLKMAESTEETVHSGRDAVLWLWNAHNQANKRLSGDVSEDPTHKKEQFPSKDLCPGCRYSDDGHIEWNEGKVLEFLVNFYGSEHIVPIEDESVSYEEKSFKGKKDKKELDWWEKQQRGKDLEKILQLRQHKKHKEEEKKKVQSVSNGKKVWKERLKKDVMMPPQSKGWFSSVDLGLCAMFYVICIVIIIILYYQLSIRRKNNLFKHCPKLS
ncbi:hypothetical protein FSP39_015352 [Pinctada imbricata]|uniref:Sulfhydryl oxidase n=1 Tax=Pinctada imbricata TaxID=66713 RepID=A0AA88XLN6_PINIB|nr:hypothetical protein FSP39_015352 [Pinctada imbricata]